MKDKPLSNGCYTNFNTIDQSQADTLTADIHSLHATMCCCLAERTSCTCKSANGTCGVNDVAEEGLRQRNCNGSVVHHNNNNEISAGVSTIAGDTPAPSTVVVQVPTRVEVLRDPANLTTFCGALLAVFALANMWKGRYYMAMCLNVLANICDIIDGPIARSTPGRPQSFSLVGSKLDCYSDLVSHFVVPASLLMHINNLAPLSILMAMMYVCAGIFRHSLFEVIGRCDEGRCVFGVTSDYMVALYCIVMHLKPLVAHQVLIYILYTIVPIMMFLCLTFSLRSRRYSGLGLATVTAYNVFLAMSCAALAFTEGSVDAYLAVYILPLLLLFAYPCYFRFVEIYR